MPTIDDLPKPSSNELNRSRELCAVIRREIEQSGGAISFAKFMQAALYHPRLGYYEAETFALGKKGDFITAPEISPLFAACFARQIAEIFSFLRGGDVLELGAGTGKLAADLLKGLAALGSLPARYYIYEISHALREKQQAFLREACPQEWERVIWLAELPRDFKGVILANEVLDALPVDCFYLTTEGIKERQVGMNQGEFVWQLALPSALLEKKVSSLLSQYHLAPAYASEVNLQLPPFIQSLANTLSQGVILLSDYGYGGREYYRPERKMGTLTCFYRHFHHDNPLILVGLQDLTAHVDFTEVAEVASEAGLSLAGYTSQAAFLLGNGLTELVPEFEKNLNQVEAFELHQGLKTLTLPSEMGERVKVMGLCKHFDHPLSGFSLQDRRRDL